MFRKFLDFVGVAENENVRSVDSFMEIFSGKTFLNGLYRIYNIEDIKKWNDIVGKAFPPAKGKIKVFGYDWAGRNFAIYNETGTAIIFEPGTGEAFDTGKDFVSFHNTEIVYNHVTCLMSEYFDEWCEKIGNRDLSHEKCVGYKIPLFLNGKDNLDNLEVSDMEVYWEIMIPLMNL